MITWGVGSIPLNVKAKVECDENLAIVIRMIWARYAKALKVPKMNRTRRIRPIKQCNKRYWPSYVVPWIINDLWSINFNNAIFYFIFILGFSRICHNNYFLLVVLRFEAPLGRCLWLMLCMQHWPIEGYLCINTLGMRRLSQHVIGG